MARRPSRNCTNDINSCPGRASGRLRWSLRFRPSFERLETRFSPALIMTVNTLGDSDQRDNVLSFREAIELSNGTLAVGQLTQAEQQQAVAGGIINTVKFDIINGFANIAVTGALPTIQTNPVIIDG